MIALLLIGAALAGAEPAPTPPAPTAPGSLVTLDEAVRRALASHPDVKAASARVSSAEARVEQTHAAKRPQLDGSASAGLSGTEPPDIVGPNPTVKVAVGLGMLVYDFGQADARTRAAEVGVDTAKAAIATTEQALIAAVEDAYFEVVARDALVEVTSAAVAAEERHLTEAQRLVKVGVAPSFDEAQVKTRLAVAKTQLARGRGNARQARANLALAMGGGDAMGLAVVTAWPGAEAGEDGPIDPLMAEALEKRADLRAADLAVRAASAGVDSAEHGLDPSLTFGAQVGTQATEDGIGAGWQASLAFKWPFLDGGLTKAEVEEARAGVVAARAQKDSLVLRVHAAIESALVAIDSAKAQAEAADASEAIAKEALRLAEARYAQGLSSGIELADAQSSVVATGADKVTAQWTLASARAALRAAIGRGAR